MKYIILFLLLTSCLFPLPKYAIQNGSHCGSCHVNPTGGALRNDHGTEIVSMDELPLSASDSFYPDDYTGIINEFMQIGGDVRVQAFSYETIANISEERVTRVFPMQSELYSFLTISERLGVYIELDLSPSGTGSEIWGIISELPFKGWLKTGNFVPNYGYRIDDHSAMTRSGAIRGNYPVATSQMPFSPFTQKPTTFEVGFSPISKLLWTFSTGSSLFSPGSSIGDLSDLNFTTRLQLPFQFMNGYGLVSLSGMKDSGNQLVGISHGVNIGIFTLESEQNLFIVSNLHGLNSRTTLYIEPTQGLSLMGAYEFVDPDSDLKSGSLHRYSLGIDVTPIPFFSIKFQTRYYQSENVNSANPAPEYIIQLHNWF